MILLGRDDVRPVGCERFELLCEFLKDTFFPGQVRVNSDYLPNEACYKGLCTVPKQQLNLIRSQRRVQLVHSSATSWQWTEPNQYDAT
jgi:hypothetical protein